MDMTALRGTDERPLMYHKRLPSVRCTLCGSRRIVRQRKRLVRCLLCHDTINEGATTLMATNDKQVIFSLVNVGKVYPPKKQVLREIYLGFYYGAKIGVLGLNGSGKSSLLKIIAGVDQNFTGEISRSKGYSIGLLEQEPQLDPNKTVKEVVEEGKHELVALLDDYNKINDDLSDPNLTPEGMEKLLEKQGKLQEK